jgi:hypothetical protein
MAIPNTVVRLLSNVPFSINYSHVRDFQSKSEQANYFFTKTKETYSQFTYQREEQAVKVPTNIDKLYDVNYLMYQNSDYSNKWFYGFVTRKEYINPNTTAIYFEPDVYQTWLFDFTFNPSYIVREHVDRWKTDGSPTINTFPEGLDYGSEYETVSVEHYKPYSDVFFLVIVSKQRLHGGSAYEGTVEPVINGSPQPLTYYVHPFKLDGTSPTINVDGVSGVLFSSVNEVLKGLYSNTTAVNNIVSLYVTEHIGASITGGTSSLTFPGDSFDHATIQDKSGNDFHTLYVTSLKTYSTLSTNLGDKYEGFTPVSESKLLMYPYTVTILDDLKGNRIELKNEYIDSPNLTLNVQGSLGTSNKVVYFVPDYKTGKLTATEDKRHVSIEHAIINNNPNDIPIITDLLSAYLQGNRNQLANQKNTILWNQSLGAVSNLMTANPLGMLHGLGSGYLQMQGLLAKQQDIQTTPPNISSQGGNTAFDYGNNISGVYIIKKQITAEYRKKLTDFFKLYGYKVNELKTPNTRSRQHFNFIHTTDVNLTGEIPQDDLQKLKEIFNNGVTIWHGDYIGDYSKVNNEV